MVKQKTQKPPKHLSAEAQKGWMSVADQYELTSMQLQILTHAWEAFDRKNEARSILDRDGVEHVDRFGITHEHPLCAYELKCRQQFADFYKKLNLDLEPLND